MFLIFGKSGSGKDYLRKNLEEHFNWKFIKSYTTRPKRSSDEDTHIFISDVVADEILKECRVFAYTEINGFKYFTLLKDVEENDYDAYIVDYFGIIDVTSLLDDYELVHIQPADAEITSKIVEDRGMSYEEKSKYDSRVSKDYSDKLMIFSTFSQIIELENDYIKSTMLANAWKLDYIKRLKKMIATGDSVPAKYIGKSEVFIKRGEIRWLSIDTDKSFNHVNVAIKSFEDGSAVCHYNYSSLLDVINNWCF